MDNSAIDRIYRGLFVYTLGFHNIMKKSLNVKARKMGVALNIWKVFTLLLEHSNESEQKLTLGQCTFNS